MTSWTVALQASLSMGFSRQEYWSGVPLPCAKLFQSCTTLCNQATEVAHQALLSIGFSRQEYWSGLPFPSPGDLPDSGIEPRSPALQAESLPTELQGRPHTGVGSCSLLQGILLTQGLNPGLPHCRQIFHCLSHQGTEILQTTC